MQYKGNGPVLFKREAKHLTSYYLKSTSEYTLDFAYQLCDRNDRGLRLRES